MGGRFIDDGQYDSHVWLYGVCKTLEIDMISYRTVNYLAQHNAHCIARLLYLELHRFPYLPWPIETGLRLIDNWTRK